MELLTITVQNKLFFYHPISTIHKPNYSIVTGNKFIQFFFIEFHTYNNILKINNQDWLAQTSIKFMCQLKLEMDKKLI